jgi:hypothetical protein
MAQWWHAPPLPMLEVRYDDLVENQEGVSRKMIEFCKLTWDPRCLDFHNSERTVHAASSQQLRQPLYAGIAASLQELRLGLVAEPIEQ